MTQGMSQKSTPAANGTAPGQIHGLGRDVGTLAVLSRRLVAYNLAYLALAWALALGAIAVFWVHPAWYTFALAFVVVSSRQQALLNCEHERVHRKFLPGGGDGTTSSAAGLCAAPVGSPFGAAQARHLTHHRLLGNAGGPGPRPALGRGQADPARPRPALHRRRAGRLRGDGADGPPGRGAPGGASARDAT